MKAKIHPQVNKVVFLDVTSNAEFISTSTLRSEETRKIDGIEHFVIRVETSSASHPVYTGKRRNEVRNDQVARYLAKVAKAQDKNKPKPAAKSTDSESKATTAKKKPAAKKSVKKAK